MIFAALKIFVSKTVQNSTGPMRSQRGVKPTRSKDRKRRQAAASKTLMLLQATTANIGSPITAYWPVMIFFVVAIAFPVLPIVLGRFLRPAKYEKGKMRPYECGIDPLTDAHSRFTVRYYIVAMLFLIFDVETIFLLPWAIIFMGDDFSFTKFALVEMFVFIGIVVVGYYYAWRKGALEWA
jgi:NADH-quinone oxidoreductase subunit A